MAKCGYSVVVFGDVGVCGISRAWRARGGTDELRGLLPGLSVVDVDRTENWAEYERMVPCDGVKFVAARVMCGDEEVGVVRVTATMKAATVAARVLDMCPACEEPPKVEDIVVKVKKNVVKAEEPVRLRWKGGRWCAATE